jgi:DOPA 4,5-dioxygenase
MAPYPSPLVGYENGPALPTTLNADGKSLTNPPAEQKSKAYEEFPEPFTKTNNAFDFHIYYMQNNADEVQFARELHERIRREFPEVCGHTNDVGMTDGK